MSQQPILPLVTTLAMAFSMAPQTVHGAGPEEVDRLWPDVAATPPRAALTPDDGVLIVSIEDYADRDLAPVEGARKSGEDWQIWFTQARGVRPDRVRWLEDKAGTSNAILRELRELSAAVGTRGTLWVVFIGHGAPTKDGREGMLLGWGAQTADEDEFYGQSVRHSELVRAARSGGPAGVVLVLDACFSGRSTTGEPLVAGLQAGVMVDAPPPEKGVLMLTAAKSDQFAGRLPGAVRPAFSYLVLGALRGWADDKERGFGDGSGKVTAGEVINYVQSALRTTAPPGRKQTPEVVGDAGLVLATLKKADLERGPDLAGIQRRLRSGADRSSEPKASDTVRVGRSEVSVGEVDLGIDVKGAKAREALAAFEGRIAAAQRLEQDASRRPEDKAAAWDGVAGDTISGQEGAKATARENAAAWRGVASKRGAMRTTWAELSEALGLRTLSVSEKKTAVERFIKAYDALGPEPELASARAALETLRAGRDTAKAAPVVASGGGAAPKGYVRIEPGRFTMGSLSGERGRDDDETEHEVRITRAFYLKATEVTQGEWKAVLGTNPSHFSSCGDTCPVEQVSWWDAIAFVNELSDREGLTRCYGEDGSFEGLSCNGYRLPTEAEWEYAARAGTTTAHHGSLYDVAWYVDNSDRTTQPVAGKRANAWGLYDMLGNVWEWVHDWKGTYGSNDSDPTGPSLGVGRVVRGGSWQNVPELVRAASRDELEPGYRSFDYGLRPARSVP
ncbi:MAG: SUMF1/EgtB/PvdO family nonheme iron enzyme [Polyangiaceae bacterium]|nr:SUMF1/EgtB/PvdO family nonheme iron enzyme [Polyangiaceae bacterium]